MKRLRLLAVVGALTALFGPLAYAAGLWWGLPIVGGPAYCTSYSLYPTAPTVPGTLPAANQCNTTAPAGPTALTGFEVMPADIISTGIGQAGVTSAYIPIALAGTGAYQFIDGRTVFIGAGNPYTVPNNTNTVLIESTTAIATLTLTMPASPLNGQIVRVGSVNTITAFWPLANAGQTLKAPVPTVLTASTTVPGGYAWVYNGTTSAWYRIQ